MDARTKPSVTGNAQAFGYSITVTVSYGAVSSARPDPTRFELVGFAMAAVAAFAILNLVVAAFTARRGLRPCSQRAMLIGTATDFLAVGAGVGAAIGVGVLIDSGAVWLLAPFAAGLLYVLTQSIELAVGQRGIHD